MATLGTWDFTGSNGTAAPSGWTVRSGTWRIQDNQLAQTDAWGSRLIYYPITSADQWMELDWDAVDAASPFLMAMAVRYNNTNDDPQAEGAYVLRVDPEGSGSLTLYRGYSWLGSASGFDWGDVLRLEAEGTTIRVLHNSVQVISVTDSGRSSGGGAALTVQPSSASSGNRWDNLSVGDFSAGGGPATPGPYWGVLAN